MPDFLDVTEQPDRESWVLSSDRANPHPSDRTLAELKVDDGATLVLHEQSVTAPAAVIDDARSTHPVPPPPATERPGMPNAL